MSDQHNIDNFFRNRFKDFEPSPDPDIWNKISTKLDEKEGIDDKKGIVFLPWLYKAAGIAAAIVLLFFIGTTVFDSADSEINPDEQTTSTSKENSSDQDTNSTTTNSQLTNTDNDVEQNTSQDKNNTTSEQELLNKEQIANENTVAPDGNTNQKVNQQNTPQGNVLQHGVAQQDASNSNSQNTANDRDNGTFTQNKTIANQKNAVANTTDQNKTANPNQNAVLHAGVTKNNTDVFNTTNKNAVAENTKNNVEDKNAASVTKGSEMNTTSPFDKNTAGIAQTATQNNNKTENSNADSAVETLENAVAEEKKEAPIKKSILDVINDLHDLEKEKTDIADVPFSRWSISPNASPVYYNAFGDGSPIHSNFADNTKTGDINLSYGVNIGYDLSKRLTVRSGIHRVDFSYSTKDIAIVPSIDGPELTTIDFGINNAEFNIQDRQAPQNQTFSQYQLPSVESSIFQKQIEGDLNQRMSFIEVPVELKYAVVDKKIGINVIGGVSTLLLTENSIILDSPELLTELGEATNVNDVSFSTNIGFGVDYKFSDQLEFNLEPMLKYQLNTFSGNTGNFNPYSVGVYTGVSFRF